MKKFICSLRLLFLPCICIYVVCLLQNMSYVCRLPCFSLPCAVDVLTTGAYPRLPACIKVNYGARLTLTIGCLALAMSLKYLCSLTVYC